MPPKQVTLAVIRDVCPQTAAAARQPCLRYTWLAALDLQASCGAAQDAMPLLSAVPALAAYSGVLRSGSHCRGKTPGSPPACNTRTFFGALLEEVRRACGVVCLTTCTSMASCISQSRAMYGDPGTVGKEMFYVCPSEGEKQPHRC